MGSIKIWGEKKKTYRETIHATQQQKLPGKLKKKGNKQKDERNLIVALKI